MKTRQDRLKKRASRTRHKLRTVAETGTLRLSVFRSNTEIYAQIIDDVKGETLVASSTKDKTVAKGLKTGSNIEAAKKVGDDLAKKAKSAGIKKVMFDRGGFPYQGRVKALGDAARNSGLEF